MFYMGLMHFFQIMFIIDYTFSYQFKLLGSVKVFNEILFTYIKKKKVFHSSEQVVLSLNLVVFTLPPF